MGGRRAPAGKAGKRRLQVEVGEEDKERMERYLLSVSAVGC